MSTITVSLYYDTSTGHLKEASSNSSDPPRRDATTDIVSGDTLIWVKGEDSNIISIDSITPTPPDTDLTFTPLPVNPTWTCQVTAIINQVEGETFDYDIWVTPSATNESTKFDPKIKVNMGT